VGLIYNTLLPSRDPDGIDLFYRAPVGFLLSMIFAVVKVWKHVIYV
jgi:hypothetical protein